MSMMAERCIGKFVVLWFSEDSEKMVHASGDRAGRLEIAEELRRALDSRPSEARWVLTDVCVIDVGQIDEGACGNIPNPRARDLPAPGRLGGVGVGRVALEASHAAGGRSPQPETLLATLTTHKRLRSR